jgi:uncharacterized damage-inducible protein DinB
MSDKQGLWTQRGFDFDFPVEEYPSLLRRLASTPELLERVTSEVPRELLVQRVDGKWSIQEHAGHLFDLEALCFARLEDFLIGRHSLTPADMSNTATEYADHNSAQLDDILDDFYMARTALVQHIETLEPRDFQRAARHPRLRRRMRLVDWMLFTAEHDDHHLGVIADLAQRR